MPGPSPAGASPKKVVSTESLLSESSVQVRLVDSTVEEHPQEGTLLAGSRQLDSGQYHRSFSEENASRKMEEFRRFPKMDGCLGLV